MMEITIKLGKLQKPISLILNGLIIFILTFFNISAATGGDWNYTWSEGPDKLGELSAEFEDFSKGGQHSPFVLTLGSEKAELDIIKKKYNSNRIFILHNCHTKQLKQDTGSTLLLDSKSSSFAGNYDLAGNDFIDDSFSIVSEHDGSGTIIEILYSFFMNNAAAAETDQYATTHVGNIQKGFTVNWGIILAVSVISLGIVVFFWKKVNDINLKTKMISLVSLLSGFVLLISINAVISMSQIGTELEEITEVDVPLIQAITGIMSNHLQQSIWLERGMVASAAVLKNTNDLSNTVTEFNRLADMVDEELNAAVSLSESGIALARNGVALAEFESVIYQLSNIEAEHNNYNRLAREVFSMIMQGQSEQTRQMVNDLEIAASNLNDEIQSLEKEISRYTEISAIRAKHLEKSVVITMSILCVLGFLLVLLLAYMIIRNILRQLGGDPSELIDIASHLANGELEIVLKKDKTGVYASISGTVEKLKEIISTIRSRAIEVSQSTDQVSDGNQNLSQRTQEQASSLEEVASSMEEMASTVSQNADNALQASQLAEEAQKKAEIGGNVARKTTTAMDAISESSKKIVDIISVIDEIAFQTNLLALNAAVEAARAGEQGRGFAVVASEVRTLAQRSATAAKEIKGLIDDSVIRVEDGIKLVTESGETLEEIINSVKKVNTIVTEITTASQEQSSGIEQVNKAVTDMDGMTQQNASLVEEAAAAAEHLGAQAQELREAVEFFKVKGFEEEPHKKQVKEEKPVAKPLAIPKVPTRQEQTRVLQSLPYDESDIGDDSDWEEF